MPFFVKKYRKLDLPVFKPETEIVSTNYLAARSARGVEADSVVRRTRVRAQGYSNLADVLAVADESFEIAAQMIGARVVAHEWGLFRDPGTCPYLTLYGNPDLLPKDHVLVAKVDVIRSISGITHEQEDKIREAKRLNTERAQRGQATVHWDDWRERQYSNGIAPGADNTDFWQLDIDPILKDRLPLIQQIKA